MKTPFPVVFLVFTLAAGHARADVPTFIVNSTADEHDLSIDGICKTASNVCTLRAAVEETNAVTGAIIEIPALTIALPLGDLPVSTSMLIRGAGMRKTVVSAASLKRIFTLAGSAYLSLSDLTLRDANISQSSGGALYAVTPASFDMDHVLVTNCSATNGGAIYTTASFTISNSVFTNCHATDSGDLQQSHGFGGAIYIQSSGSGSLLAVLDSCTLDTNTSVSGGGAIRLADGYGTVKLVNCTVSGNTAGNPGPASTGSGGGISVLGSTLTLDHVSVTNNFANASLGGGGISNAAAASAVSFSHSLIAKNQDVFNGAAVDGDCAGPVTSTACNMLGAAGTGHCTVTGFYIGGDPLFGPLQDNGGPTPTHALLSGSLAVDFTCLAQEHESTDQRGVHHLGTYADLGAYERAPCGDVDGNGTVNLADVFFLINFLFAGGSLPPGLADVNQDASVNISDVFSLINALFAGGPAPSCPGT
jgi:predicted outer membrane repeat protein